MGWAGVLTGSLIGLSLLIWLTVGPSGLAVILPMTIVIELLARNLVDHRLPFGWFSALNVGLAGGWLGGWFLSESYGPGVGELPIFPALFGVISARILADIYLVRGSARSGSQ